MKLNYRDIMGLALPPGGLDVGAIVGMVEMYTLALGAYMTRAREDMWAEDEPCFVRRVAWFRREINTAQRDVRRGNMYNFALRVKTWVLSSKARRLRLRALIGEHKITRWSARLAARTAVSTMLDAARLDDRHGDEIGFEVTRDDDAQNQNQNQNQSQIQNKPHDKKQSLGHLRFPRSGGVRPWYRLPSLPRQPDLLIQDPPLGQNCDLNTGAENAPYLRTQYRAIPAIPFWPHELVKDYIADDEALGVLRDEDEFENASVTRLKIKQERNHQGRPQHGLPVSPDKHEADKHEADKQEADKQEAGKNTPSGDDPKPP